MGYLWPPSLILPFLKKTRGVQKEFPAVIYTCAHSTLLKIYDKELNGLDKVTRGYIFYHLEDTPIKRQNWYCKKCQNGHSIKNRKTENE